MAHNFDRNLNKNIIKPNDCHVDGSGLFTRFAQSIEIAHFLYSIYLAIYCFIFIFNIKK